MRCLREDLWLLELGWSAPLGSNAYLIDDGIDPETGDRTGGDVTLIDTGYRYNRRSLEGELEAAGYAPDDIDRVLLTHYDLDHTWGLDSVSFDCPVYLGERDVALVEGTWDPPITHHKGLFHRAARQLFSLPDDTDLHDVSDEQRIGRFTAYHTPGHNPGHTAYIHDADVAFLGDLLWETDGELTTPFWGDSYDMRQLRESVRNLQHRCPPFDIACIGHGEPITDRGYERLQTLAEEM
ncbi:MBL fold metallo-hydrolase [Halocatena salina]|uniref:MBL fold metallo-hydrolase n=1 Tax=Halocatena salina TaxID=2934340 RepID=A0A8U0A3L1_9EURY|nr:MBL fold metallo-hydrolase [Halocatena salina]UPM43682.1 MBL fold metallo-hydrolase [Halocatena salina]